MALISFSARLRELAEADPDRAALTCGPDTLTRAEARTLDEDGYLYPAERAAALGQQ